MYKTVKNSIHEKGVEKIYDKKSIIEEAIKDNKKWDKEHKQENILKQKAIDEERYNNIARNLGEDIASAIAEKEYRERRKNRDNTEEK